MLRKKKMRLKITKEGAEKAKHEAAKTVETSKQITEQAFQESSTAQKNAEKAKASVKEKLKQSETVKM